MVVLEVRKRGLLIMCHAQDRLLDFLKTEWLISADIAQWCRSLFVYVKCSASLLLTGLFLSCSCCHGKGLPERDDHRRWHPLTIMLATPSQERTAPLCVCTWVDGPWGVQPVVLPLYLQGPKIAQGKERKNCPCTRPGGAFRGGWCWLEYRVGLWTS